MFEPPLFTIVIPVYNRGQLIKDAINSVLKQTISNWKLLIIDDKSTDNTIEIIRPFLNDKRIKLIPLKENIGLSKTMNRALEQIDSPYFVQLDSDDWFEKNTLELLANSIKNADKNTALFYGNSKLHSQIKNKQNFAREIRHRQFSDKYDFLQYITYTITPRCYRTEAIKSLGGWEINNLYEGRIMEDRIMCLKIVEKFPLKWIDEQLYNCRMHTNQLSGKDSFVKRNILRKRVIEETLKRWGNEYKPIYTENRRGYLKLKRLKKIKP